MSSENKNSFVFCFWPRCAACRILVPRPGTEPGPRQWKRQVLTTGPPGNSPVLFIYSRSIYLLSPFLLLMPQLGLPVMLKRSGKRGHPCLVPDPSGKASSFSPLSMTLAIDILWMFFTKLRKFPAISSLLRNFIRNGCWILPTAFSASTDRILWYFFFSLLTWWTTLSDFCIILFIHCWN